MTERAPILGRGTTHTHTAIIINSPLSFHSAEFFVFLSAPPPGSRLPLFSLSLPLSPRAHGHYTTWANHTSLSQSLCQGLRLTLYSSLSLPSFCCTHHSGATYRGDWKKGKKNGHGRFLWANGTAYEVTCCSTLLLFSFSLFLLLSLNYPLLL